MEHLELFVFGLLVVVALLAVLARWLRVPYPILLVLGGSALGFLPGVPDVELDPDLVLLLFLPPLLYAAAFFANLHELRRNVRPIGLLAVGLVAATMVAVAATAHAVIGLDWSVAFILGAIVAPTDVVAPSAVIRRLGVPRRIVTIVEGESLTNDATALVLYRIAVAAVVSGSFELWEAGPRFLLASAGGVAVGLAAGWLVAAVRRHFDDPPTEITIALLTGYAAYLPAEELGFSGIVAAVTVGIYMGSRTSELTTATTRMQGTAVWEILRFILEAVLFVLIGLQLPDVLDSLDGFAAADLLAWGALVSVVVIVTRLVWVFAFTYLPGALRPRRRDQGSPAPWTHALLVAWSGVRGAVSLAAALAIPVSIDAGGPFPDRDLVIFLTYCVILGTLVLQGLTLPVLIRVLGLEDDGLDREEELLARVVSADRARERLEELADEDWTNDDTVERLRGMYGFRQRRFTSLRDGDGDYEGRSEAYQRLTREAIDAQREALLDLRDAGRITDEVMRRVERDLDLEESRLDAPA